MAVCFLLPYKHPGAKIMLKKWFSVFIFQPSCVCTRVLVCGFIILCCINSIFIFFFSLRHSNPYLMKCFDFGREIFALSLSSTLASQKKKLIFIVMPFSSLFLSSLVSIPDWSDIQSYCAALTLNFGN